MVKKDIVGMIVRNINEEKLESVMKNTNHMNNALDIVLKQMNYKSDMPIVLQKVPEKTSIFIIIVIILVKDNKNS